MSSGENDVLIAGWLAGEHIFFRFEGVIKMKSLRRSSNSSRMAATVAPEDLNPGDFVAILKTTCEYPSFFWDIDLSDPLAHEPVRIEFTWSDGEPLKVKAICLPFVHVKSANGKSQTLDVRKMQLVRVNKSYAATVWSDYKSNSKS